jgi:hypothetical protein
MTAQLRKIRAAISKHDYRILKVGDNEAVLFAFAKASGIDVCELMRLWQRESDHVVRPTRTARDPEFPVDDDDWPTDENKNAGNDDTEQELTTCPVCRGKDRDSSGRTSARCGGSGRVPLDEESDDDEAEE